MSCVVILVLVRPSAFASIREWFSEHPSHA
jgi:hypothetical protein